MKSQGIFNFLLSGNPAVSAPTPGRTSILFLLPDLHLHLYNFSFQTWISVYVALLSSCTVIFTSSAPITELLSLVILLLSQPLYVFSSAFSSTPTLHLCCLCAHSLTALARSSLLLCFSIYTFIFTKSAPSLPFVLYLHLQIHLSLFPHRHLYFHPYVTGLINGFNLYSCYENLFKEVVLKNVSVGSFCASTSLQAC